MDHRSEVLPPARQRYLREKDVGVGNCRILKAGFSMLPLKLYTKTIGIIVQDYVYKNSPYNKFRFPLLSSIVI